MRYFHWVISVGFSLTRKVNGKLVTKVHSNESGLNRKVTRQVLNAGALAT